MISSSDASACSMISWAGLGFFALMGCRKRCRTPDTGCWTLSSALRDEVVRRPGPGEDQLIPVLRELARLCADRGLEGLDPAARQEEGGVGQHALTGFPRRRRPPSRVVAAPREMIEELVRPGPGVGEQLA